MKAYFLNEAGPADNLQLKETPMPELKTGEVLVKVKAISINPVDYKARSNENTLTWIFQDVRPVILGWDISGVVEKVEGDSAFKVGDEVFGMVNFIGSGNAYAEYVAAPSDHLALKPSNLSFEEAAGATLAALTAHQAIKTAGVKSGAKALVHGASGGVGHFAVQILKNLGADVYGTSSGSSKTFVESFGAKHINYNNEQFEEYGNDFDFVLDGISGETLNRSIGVVKKGGQIITIPSHAYSDDYKVKAEESGVKIQFILVSSNSADMKELANLMASGKLTTNVEEVFSFDKLPQAHDRLQAGNVKGKVIIHL